jgi:hypothetical protein
METTENNTEQSSNRGTKSTQRYSKEANSARKKIALFRT